MLLTGKLVRLLQIDVPNTLSPNTLSPASTTEISTVQHNQSAGYLTAVIAVLAIALLGTTAGWIVTCVVAWRRSSNKSW